MRRLWGLGTLCVLFGASSIYAHHSYGDFVRDRPVSIEGQVEDVMFANPHVMITMKTRDGEVYKAEWGSILQLRRYGVTNVSIKPGDWIVVEGSRHRDPSTKLISLLQEVRRPSDNWSWTPRNRPANK